jgi:hypothetical protein
MFHKPNIYKIVRNNRQQQPSQIFDLDSVYTIKYDVLLFGQLHGTASSNMKYHFCVYAIINYRYGSRTRMSSPARTLGSCVRIPWMAWMSVFILFVLGRGLATD